MTTTRDATLRITTNAFHSQAPLGCRQYRCLELLEIAQLADYIGVLTHPKTVGQQRICESLAALRKMGGASPSCGLPNHRRSACCPREPCNNTTRTSQRGGEDGYNDGFECKIIPALSPQMNPSTCGQCPCAENTPALRKAQNGHPMPSATPSDLDAQATATELKQGQTPDATTECRTKQARCARVGTRGVQLVEDRVPGQVGRLDDVHPDADLARGTQGCALECAGERQKGEVPCTSALRRAP